MAGGSEWKGGPTVARPKEKKCCEDGDLIAVAVEEIGGWGVCVVLKSQKNNIFTIPNSR